MHAIYIIDLSKTQVSSRVKWLSKAKYQHVCEWRAVFSANDQVIKKGKFLPPHLKKNKLWFLKKYNEYLYRSFGLSFCLLPVFWIWLSCLYFLLHFVVLSFKLNLLISLHLSCSRLISLTCVWSTFLVALHVYLLLPRLDACFWVCVSALFSFLFRLQSFLDLFSLFPDLLGQVAQMTTYMVVSLWNWDGITGDEDGFLIC